MDMDRLVKVRVVKGIGVREAVQHLPEYNEECDDEDPPWLAPFVENGVEVRVQIWIWIG